MDENLYHYRATVVSVYDADTIRVNINLGFGINTSGFDGKGVSIRLYGLNAPEVRGEEKQNGIKSRNALRQKILGKEIILKTIKDKKGKYGRYLGIVFLKDENINDWLLSNGLAKEYLL